VNSRIEFVLDSSALLALLRGEPGGDSVRSVLETSVIGAVNYSEVLTKMIRKGTPASLASQMLQAVRLAVVPFDQPLALEGADLAAYGWTHGLSLADRACLTLARHHQVPAVTADRRWKIRGLPVKVRFIR